MKNMSHVETDGSTRVQPRVCIYCLLQMRRAGLKDGCKKINAATVEPGYAHFHSVHVAYRHGMASHIGFMCGHCKAKGFSGKIEINILSPVFEASMECIMCPDAIKRLLNVAAAMHPSQTLNGHRNYTTRAMVEPAGTRPMFNAIRMEALD